MPRVPRLRMIGKPNYQTLKDPLNIFLFAHILGMVVVLFLQIK